MTRSSEAQVENLYAARREPGSEASAVLTVDLNALRLNYSALKKVVTPAECAAVVKADAYGVGVIETVDALINEGCNTFFVATLEEARQIKPIIRDGTIYVLNGLFPDTAPLYAEISAEPVLSSMDEIYEWSNYCAQQGVKFKAAIHIDTGMNRLGLRPSDVETLAANSELLETFELTLIMSHLACADDPIADKNQDQLIRFNTLRSLLPPCRASIANSAGMLLGKAYHLDLVRPGYALYGGRALSKGPNPMKQVVCLDARIAQVKDAAAGETIGYGATRTLTSPARLAIIAAGYGDGFMRLLGLSNETPSAVVYIGDEAAPVLGRISMDLFCVDVTHLPHDKVQRGQLVELIGPHMDIDDLAKRASTIGYEILTNLGRRYERRYIGR